MPRPLLALAVSAAAALAPAADAGAWQAGNWTGRTVQNETGAFGGGRLSVAYDNGNTPHFLHLAGFSLLIGPSRPDWALDPRGNYAMRLVIDGRYVRRARGTVLASLTDSVFLSLGRDRATRDLLRRSLRLTLVNNRQSFDFQLAGTAAGLARLERCVRERG